MPADGAYCSCVKVICPRFNLHCNPQNFVYAIKNPWIRTSHRETLTMAWNTLQKAREVYTFVTWMVVPPLLAFKASFEGVPVIWVKQLVVSEVLRYTGRLLMLYMGSWGFERHFLGPLHFLLPLSGGCRTCLRIWDEQACLPHYTVVLQYQSKWALDLFFI